MSFQVPLPHVQKQQPKPSSPVSCLGLPQFTKEQLSGSELIGVGSYGKVFKVRKDGLLYVMKELERKDSEELKLFQKEARLLKELSAHENVVQIHGYSTTIHSMLLEYCCFSFQNIGIHHDPVYNMKEFVSTVHNLNKFSGFQHIQHHICKDILAGLDYLHDKQVVHRDLKPDNVLVSNTHYHGCSKEEVENWWSTKPIIAKLTDFGESRSVLIQTRKIVQTHTNNLYRGSAVYMAPEAFCSSEETGASLADMKNMDLWSLGMTLFHLIHPDVTHPYALEIQQSGNSPMNHIKTCIKNKQLPSGSLMYEDLRKGIWKPVVTIYEACVKFKAFQRVPVKDLRQQWANSNIRIESLAVSQESISEETDKAYAQGLPVCHDKNKNTSNACSFLSVIIGDRILSSKDHNSSLVEIANDVLLNFPKSINENRNTEIHYSTDEAYKLLKDKELVGPHYLKLKITSCGGKPVYSAQTELCEKLSAIMSHQNDEPLVALYTCPPYVFTICKQQGDEIALVDTHPLSSTYQGNFTGAVVTAAYKETTFTSLCDWLFRRMGYGSRSSAVVYHELVVMRRQDLENCYQKTHAVLNKDKNISEYEDLTDSLSEPDLSFTVSQCSKNIKTAEEIKNTTYHRKRKDHVEGLSHFAAASQVCDTWPKRPKLVTDQALFEFECSDSTDEEINTPTSFRKRKKHGEGLSDSITDSLGSDNLSRRLSLSESQCSEFLKTVKNTNTASSASEDEGHAEVQLDSSTDSPCIDQMSKRHKVTDDKLNDTYFCTGSHWQNNEKIPVYALTQKTPYSTENIFKLLFNKEEHKDKLCTQRPLCVRQDAVFLIDLNYIDRKDIRADGNGTFSKELRHYRWVIKFTNEKSKRIKTPGGIDNYILKDDEYFLYWNSYFMPETGLRRQINWIIDKIGNTVNNVALLQYSLPEQLSHVNFTPKAHGLSKNKEAFTGRLAHSTLEKMKKKSMEKPSTVVREFNEADPLMSDPCSMPSLKSVYNCRFSSKSNDPLQEILDYNEELPSSVIIGQHGVPGITIVFQTSYMANNAKFIEKGAIIQVDTTYGPHNFYVTIVATQDKSLRTKQQNHPWVMLAVAFHEKKNQFVHELIVHDIVHATPVIKEKQPIIITDAESSIWKAWQHYGYLLRCTNHFKQNFTLYLTQDLHIPKQHVDRLMRPIFQKGGLIDCENKEEMLSKLHELKYEYDNWEATALNKTIGYSSKAYQWLVNRVDMINDRLLKEARREAGFPPTQRPNTNGVEAFNHRLKQIQAESHSRAHKLSFLEYFTKVILTVEKDMEANFSKALISKGDYILADEYAYLSMTLQSWLSLTNKEREDYLQQVKMLTLKEVRKAKPVIINATEENENTTLDIILPHTTIKTTLVQRNIPEEVIHLMILGAEHLLNSSDMISRKPSRTLSRQYIVHTGEGNFHTCTVLHLRHVTCDCRGYKSKIACRHSIAVAYKENLLLDHLKWLKRQPIKQNKTVLVTKNKPGTGQKGGRQKTKPRFGASAREPSSCTIEDADYDGNFTKCYHNNEKFTVIRKDDVRKERYKCWHCNQQFESVVPKPPNNLVIHHRGAWEYPSQEGSGANKKLSKSYTDYYYHIKRACVRERYPYFLPSMLEISDKVICNKVQREMLESELGYSFSAKST